MPSPKKVAASPTKEDEVDRPANLELPELGSDGISSTPSPSPNTNSYNKKNSLTPSSPKWIDDIDDSDEEAAKVFQNSCDNIDKSGHTTDPYGEDLPDGLEGKGERKGGGVAKPHNEKVSSPSQDAKEEKKRKSRGSQSPETSQKRKGWRFRGSNGKKSKESKAKCPETSPKKSPKKSSSRQHHHHSPKETKEAPMSPRTRELAGGTDRSLQIPGSPRRSERSKSKQEQLHERHLERRNQGEGGHKKLTKRESEIKLVKDPAAVDSDDDTASRQHEHHEHRHHHHHKSPRRTRSERRSSHRSRSSSVSSRRYSEQHESNDNLSFSVPNRWLSYDRLSQSSDCELKSNGSMIHLEYPYKPSNNQGIYISPYFSSAYRAPGAEVLIASLIMIVGVVGLITYFATDMEIWLIVGGVCLALGGMFMLLGFCWYCALSSRKKEEHQVQLKVKKLKEMVRLERSQSNPTDIKEEGDVQVV